MKNFYNHIKTDSLFLNIVIVTLWSPIFLILGIFNLIKLPIQAMENKIAKIKEKPKTKKIKNISDLEKLNKKFKKYKITKIITFVLTIILIFIYIPLISFLDFLFPLDIIINSLFAIIGGPVFITYIVVKEKQREYDLKIMKYEILQAIKNKDSK